MTRSIPNHKIEAVARAILEHSENEGGCCRSLRICSGPAPCRPNPQSCSCTEYLHPLAEVAIDAWLKASRKPRAVTNTIPIEGKGR
jgi:hypothetical protein